MDFFRKMKAVFIKEEKNDFGKEENKIVKVRERFELSPEEEGLVKKAFLNRVIELVNKLDEKQEDALEIVKLIIAPNFLTDIAADENLWMQAEYSDSSPLIVDSDYKLLKRLSIKELEISPEDRQLIDRLNKKLMNQKLDNLSAQLDYMNVQAEEVNKKLKNERYTKVNEAIQMVRQSTLEDDEKARQELANTGESMLNSSIEALYKNIEDYLDYFRGWDSRSELNNDYSVKNTNRLFNQLMKDYLFFTSAKSALIELKEKQGMNRQNLYEWIKDLNKVDRQFKEMKMEGWLAPPSKQNSWQHRLFKAIDTNSKDIIIHYVVEELV